jgi:hypothetical protein
MFNVLLPLALMEFRSSLADHSTFSRLVTQADQWHCRCVLQPLQRTHTSEAPDPSGFCTMAGILAVPIHGAEDEVLELPKDQLPDDPNEIMQILANELAPLKLWLELAVSYYQQHRMEQFNIVMETSTGDEGSS